MLAKLRPLLIPHLAKSLETAVLAQNASDYGTVCRNIGVIIEGSIAGSLIHIIRGDYGVQLPFYIDRYDPLSEKIYVGSIDINEPIRHIGFSNMSSKIPWKAKFLCFENNFILFHLLLKIEGFL